MSCHGPNDLMLGYVSKESSLIIGDDDAIIILPADKGRATVILNKEDYIRKCNDHIGNGPYQCLKKDLTESIKREARQKLQHLLDRNIIYKELCWKLKPTDSSAPRFYGL